MPSVIVPFSPGAVIRAVVWLVVGGCVVVSCANRPNVLVTATDIPNSAESIKTLAAGDTVRLRADFSRSNRYGSCAHDRHASPTEPDAFTWTSEDPSVAAVNPAGRVTALKPGRARVTATIEGASGTITVVVVPRAAATTIRGSDGVSGAGG